MLNQAIKRLRHNFQLSIITLMGSFGIFSLTPYAIYRMYHANYTVAIADSFAIFSIINWFLPATPCCLHGVPR